VSCELWVVSWRSTSLLKAPQLKLRIWVWLRPSINIDTSSNSAYLMLLMSTEYPSIWASEYLSIWVSGYLRLQSCTLTLPSRPRWANIVCFYAHVLGIIDTVAIWLYTSDINLPGQTCSRSFFAVGWIFVAPLELAFFVFGEFHWLCVFLPPIFSDFLPIKTVGGDSAFMCIPPIDFN